MNPATQWGRFKGCSSVLKYTKNKLPIGVVGHSIHRLRCTPRFGDDRWAHNRVRPFVLQRRNDVDKHSLSTKTTAAYIATWEEESLPGKAQQNWGNCEEGEEKPEGESLTDRGWAEAGSRSVGERGVLFLLEIPSNHIMAKVWTGVDWLVSCLFRILSK